MLLSCNTRNVSLFRAGRRSSRRAASAVAACTAKCLSSIGSPTPSGAGRSIGANPGERCASVQPSQRKPSVAATQASNVTHVPLPRPCRPGARGAGPDAPPRQLQSDPAHCPSEPREACTRPQRRAPACRVTHACCAAPPPLHASLVARPSAPKTDACTSDAPAMPKQPACRFDAPTSSSVPFPHQTLASPRVNPLAG